MTRHHHARGFWEPVSYWSQWMLLQVYGPASQDEASDPIAQLKREHHRT